MASNVTSGFFDSTESEPRVYTAEEFSSIFDGLISDGVYEAYPGKDSNGNIIQPFKVTPINGNGYSVNVGPGRAWFKHVWALNTNSTLDIDAPHATFNRIDTVILRINKGARSCDLYISKGTPSDSPVAHIPGDDNNNFVYYYPIAYITVPSTAATASAFTIRTAIGESNGKTQLIKTIVQPSMTLDDYVNRYVSQANQWKADMQELITGTPSLEFVAEVQDLKDRVDGLDDATGSEGLSGYIESVEGVANTAAANVSTLMSYLNSGLKYYNTNAGDIDKPKETFCRMFYDSSSKKGVKGTKPTGMGNQWTVYTMNTNATALYNVQVAIGFSYRIAMRRKNGKSSWESWRYINLTATG